ncbi:MAG: nickel pincer cofactor biosynthesis protein LarC [Methanosphaera sp.]|nr:nickel pincer cofactor biosynthesis protein LarC [Methanosphaera sp.]
MSLIIDPQVSGLSGNMFIGAFLDLGVDEDKLVDVIKTYAGYFGSVDINISKKSKCGVITTYADIQTTDNTTRHYDEIISQLDKITEDHYSDDILVKEAVSLAKKIFKTLAIAESKVHNKSLDELHFHEVGCADAVADIIGSSYAFYLLGLDKEEVYSLPVSVGSGSVKTQHGILPVPAPAVMNILEDVPITGGSAKCELATPTGCAILVNITDKYVESMPITTKRRVGYGAGSHELDTLNALRLIIAEDNYGSDTVTVLETNVDTLSGEVLGSIYEDLLDNGARDVTITPTVMKKNRPGHIIKVICRNSDAEKLTNRLMKITGSLGIRVSRYTHRGVARREIKQYNLDIDSRKELINFKIGYLDNGDIIKATPEYDDVKRLSDEKDIPVKDLMDIIKLKYEMDVLECQNQKQ